MSTTTPNPDHKAVIPQIDVCDYCGIVFALFPGAPDAETKRAHEDRRKHLDGHATTEHAEASLIRMVPAEDEPAVDITTRIRRAAVAAGLAPNAVAIMDEVNAQAAKVADDRQLREDALAMALRHQLPGDLNSLEAVQSASMFAEYLDTGKVPTDDDDLAMSFYAVANHLDRTDEGLGDTPARYSTDYLRTTARELEGRLR